MDSDLSPPKHTAWCRFLYRVAMLTMPIFRHRLNMKGTRYKGKIKDPSVIMYNHAAHTDFIMACDILPVYARFVATDAILRKPIPRFIVPKVTNMIYRKKGQRADAVVESAKMSIDAGLHVCIAPEGNATQNGASENVRPRTGQLIKDSNAGMVIIRQWGNYFHMPFWARNESKGPMFGEVARIYSKEEVAAMSVDEINAAIARDIKTNNYEWNRKAKVVYDRECRAECMERVAFMCPKCKAIGHMHSHKDTLSCDACGYSVDVDEYGFFIGEDAVFDNLYDWDMWQIKELREKIGQIQSDDEEIFSYGHVKVQRMDGNEPILIDPDASLTMSSKVLCIKGSQVDMTVPISDVISFSSLFADSIGVNISGTFYQLRSLEPASNRLPRVALKILRNEPL